MKAVLLGAAGIIGTDIARYLAMADSVEITLSDFRRDRVEVLAQELGLQAELVDVTDRTATARLLKGCDLAVNATWYYHNVSVMKACLGAGCDYVDLGGLYHTTRRQLALGREFIKEKRLAILGCGKAPGITNILAAKGATSFDDIEAVHLRSGRRPLEELQGLRLPYSPQTLLDEFTLRPVVLQDEELREVEPLSGRESVRHPDPVGSIKYVTTLHSELATLPAFIGKGVRSMEFKVALAGDTVHSLETLVSLGFASEAPVATPSGSAIPRDVAVAVLSRIPSVRGREVWIVEVEIVGLKKGRTRTLHLRAFGTEKVNGTALAAAVTIEMIREGLIRNFGVHAPESVIPADEFLRRLGKGGLTITETLTEVAEVSG